MGRALRRWVLAPTVFVAIYLLSWYVSGVPWPTKWWQITVVGMGVLVAQDVADLVKGK